MIYKSKLEEFKRLIGKIEILDNTRNSLIYWDKITNMPEEGIEYRSKVLAFLADEHYKLLSGREFSSYVKYFKNNKRNDELTDAMVRHICYSSDFVNRIPENEYKDYVELFTKSEQVWEKAKDEKNFAALLPYWEKIFNHFRRFAKYWGYKNEPYDALMDYYVDTLTVEKVDERVEETKSILIDYREKILANTDVGEIQLKDLPEIDSIRQQEIWKMILSEMGFSFSAGRVDIGAHPTILPNSPSDVRIVNSYSEKDFRVGIYNVLHEGGKGIYHQSIDKHLMGTFLADAPSWVLEEAIGRFYENIIGRSKAFWSRFYDKICEIAPELKKYSACEMFRSVNCIASNPIRIEADELNYLLHIIIRYELEREIFRGTIELKDLPDLWNQKYEEYLGIKPAHDGEGVLQDIHWSAGYVGYFPTYITANLAATQIKAAIEKRCGNLDELIMEGRFDVINGWLKENIFRHGAIYTTAEILENATGQPLDSSHYIDYLRNKFSEVYKINL